MLGHKLDTGQKMGREELPERGENAEHGLNDERRKTPESLETKIPRFLTSLGTAPRTRVPQVCSSPGGPRAPLTEEGLRGDPFGDKVSEDRDKNVLPTKHRLCQQGGSGCQRISVYTGKTTRGECPACAFRYEG